MNFNLNIVLAVIIIVILIFGCFNIFQTKENFELDLIKLEDGIASFALKGKLNVSTVSELKKSIEKLSGVKGLLLDLNDLDEISDIGWNYLLFTKQRAGADYTLQITNANNIVKQSLKDAELDEEFELV